MAITGDPAAICLTGGSGFIGSHVLTYLKKQNIDLIPFTGNLLIKDEVDAFFKGNKIKNVIHLAGNFAGSFEKLIEKNLFITQNLLETATQYGIERFIYSSTGAVYGEPVTTSSTETDILNPNTEYGLIKMFTENCIHYHQTKSKFNAIILRFPNVYGEGNKKGVLYNFLESISKTGEITIAGDGTQTRNFLHVSDACVAIEKALTYEDSGVFNISNPLKLSINDIVSELRKQFTFNVQYTQQKNLLKDLLLNTEKAEQLLGFKASVSHINDYIRNFAINNQ